MKVIFLALALFCAIACASASFGRRPRPNGPNIPRFPEGLPRFRREANPQGSLVLHGTKPLSGPDRRPSLDVDYNQRFHDRNGLTAGTYGGLNIRPGQPPQPHAGINVQREYKNGFVGGFGQVERRPGGGASPTFGVNGGFRFRRDVDEVEEEVEEQHRERREANPQGSLVLHGTKPLSGPDRRPSLDVDYNQRFHDRNGVTAGTYGGLNIRPGQPPQPHAGINVQREYKNGFIGGFGQVERRPGGGASPTFGVNGGFRFRRDVDEVEEEEVEEQHRERREANPQGSLVLHGTKPLSGPDRRPSLDVDYNQRFHDRNGVTAGTYGGLNIRPGQPPQPHAGINVQREYKNGFVGGFGQVQRRPGGGASPTFGVNGGFRFRRDVDEVEEEEVEEQHRERREANPQGSLVLHGTKPLSGPDRRPSLDVDYNQRFHDRNGVTAGTYGGLNIRPGQPPQPHAGINVQREYKNGFIGGFGQVQRRPGGGASPTFGVNGGFRFRRDVDEVEEEVEEQHRERREANPQGSLVLHGTKPLSGPDRRPSLDVDYNQRFHDRNGVTAGTYGGLNIRPGQPPQPHAGINVQREYKNGFIGGFGQVERRPGGGASPTFGVNGGFRFRRDVDEVEEEVEEQHRERREANPQGSLVLHGTKPLSGPDRRPSLDVDYNQRFHDRNGVTAGTYGGLNIRPGQPPQPHAGINVQREYKNGFIGGFGQVQRRPGGGASPTFGVNGGFRFRRDADEVEEEE